MDPISLPTTSGKATCPECLKEIHLYKVLQFEIVSCPKCGAKVEVTEISPDLELEIAPPCDETWDIE